MTKPPLVPLNWIVLALNWIVLALCVLHFCGVW